MSVLWKDCTTRGATIGGFLGLFTAVVLTLLSKSVWTDVLGYGEAPFPYASPALFSMFVGFFFWYRGLAMGGIARVGQVQLLQPFLSLVGAAVLLGEPLTLHDSLFALAVIAVVFAGRRLQVRRRPG